MLSCRVRQANSASRPARGFIDDRLMHAPQLRRQRLDLGAVDAFGADVVPIQARGVDLQRRR
jgi:hypothetical protein